MTNERDIERIHNRINIMKNAYFPEPENKTRKEKALELLLSWDECKRKNLILLNWLYLTIVMIASTFINFDMSDEGVIRTVSYTVVLGIPTTIIVSLICGCMDSFNNSLFDKMMDSAGIFIGSFIMALLVVAFCVVSYLSYTVVFN